MTIQTDEAPKRSGRRSSRGSAAEQPVRRPDYRNLVNPFRPQTVFSEDQLVEIHDTALRVLEELGLLVHLPEARETYRRAGALVDEESRMVRIGRDIILEALAQAPKSIAVQAGDPGRNMLLELGRLYFIGGGGAPNCTDIERGRRPGTLADFEDFVRLAQGFDVIHFQGAHVEAQDIEPPYRHYAVNRAQLVLSDKLPFLYARGTPQVEDGFEMVRLARGLSPEVFRAAPYSYTVINTNSPRQLDIPMAQGIIDFARFGQISIITPFCLAGAMAPITVAGALTLQHAEALAGIALAQLTRAGAPVVYGSFLSNVDMKSGAPAFGTPEHVKATLGSGQLARHIGLPWRGGGGSAANISDVQAAPLSQSAPGAPGLPGGPAWTLPSGWLEGGLANSFEKFVTDVEALQIVAELCTTTAGDRESIGFDAIAAVDPGGHFFAGEHTMQRYRTAFYEPLVADLSNFGSWSNAGSKDATARAHRIYKKRMAEFQPPAACAVVSEALEPFIARRQSEGGALPVS
jgi:trimethylamine--corrinoid protein Co-methyltransferase